MKIQEKQYNLLNRVLKGYALKKNINQLSVFEASLIIEGILNNGIVKKEFNGKLLSESDFLKRQTLFSNLVEKNSEYATERQIKYIESLLSNSKYKLKTFKILKKDVNHLITFLKGGDANINIVNYIEKKSEPQLIKLKKIVPEIKPDLPSDWVMQNIEINGIIDFT